MSELLTKYAGRKVSEVPPQELRLMITDFIKDAEFLMGGEKDNEYSMRLIGWCYNFLNERYGFMPMSHVNAAFKFGSGGQRGGTSKLIPRNIVIWLNGQNELLQEQIARMIKKEDDDKRVRELNAPKADFFVGTAVRMKVCWLADKRITSEEYDTFSAQKIYELLKAGVPEKNIHPRDVVPNYDLNRAEV